MNNYLVTWEIDICANSPEEAAADALATQRDPNSRDTFFTVQEEGSNTVLNIDLDDHIPPTQTLKENMINIHIGNLNLNGVQVPHGMLQSALLKALAPGVEDWPDLGETEAQEPESSGEDYMGGYSDGYDAGYSAGQHNPA